MAAEMPQQCKAVAKQPAQEENVTTPKRKDSRLQYLVCPTSSWSPHLLMVWHLPLPLLLLLLLSCVQLVSLGSPWGRWFCCGWGLLQSG